MFFCRCSNLLLIHGNRTSGGPEIISACSRDLIDKSHFEDRKNKEEVKFQTELSNNMKKKDKHRLWRMRLIINVSYLFGVFRSRTESSPHMGNVQLKNG